MGINNRSKRAFTLTELLIVVVVIGVLATLTLPKFSKVLETRKTTEAENILRAVRTEQERRCALDKNYLGDLNKMSDLVPNTTTANYTYAALTGGIRAQSNGSLSYQLQMPSYADGRICCTGTDCSQLNKDYPTCDELRAMADYVASPSECAADVGETPDPAQCGPQPADDVEDCPSGTCGAKTRSYICNPSTGQWEPGPWQGTCTPLLTPEPFTESRPCESGSANETRQCTRTYSCDASPAVSCGAWSGCYQWKKIREWCQGACTGDGPCNEGQTEECVPPPNASCNASNLGQVLERYDSACSYDPEAGSHGEGGYALSFCDYQCVRA